MAVDGWGPLRPVAGRGAGWETRSVSVQNIASIREFMTGLAEGHPRELHVLDPEIEWHVEDTLPDAAVYHGHAGVEEFFAGLRQVWDGLRLEADGFIDAGDRVLVEARQTGRGAGSDALVEQRLYPIFEMRDGRAVRMDVYFDRERAFAALRDSG